MIPFSLSTGGIDITVPARSKLVEFSDSARLHLVFHATGYKTNYDCGLSQTVNLFVRVSMTGRLLTALRIMKCERKSNQYQQCLTN